MKTALHDQFVCGLKDTRCQQELLTIANLTIELAQQKAQAVEVIALETKSVKELEKEGATLQEDEVHILHVTCYRHGKEGHKASDCRHKKTKCHTCHKTGYLAKVCQSNRHKTVKKKVNSGRWKGDKQGGIRAMDGDNSTEPSLDEQLHGIFHVDGKSPKFMVAVTVNGVQIKMEVDTRSVFPVIIRIPGSCNFKRGN